MTINDPITTCLEPIRHFWDLVGKHGWQSREVCEEACRIQSQRWAPVFGHAERLMRAGRNPISYVDYTRRTCSECKSTIDEKLCSLLFSKRKLLLCEECWRYLYPVARKPVPQTRKKRAR